jgi:hypothetical protein
MKTAGGTEAGSQKTRLPPKPSPVTSGSNTTSKSNPVASDTGKPLAASGSSASSSMSPFRGHSATISLPPPPLHERHDLLAGWIDLYDGMTLFGWKEQSKAKWETASGMLSVKEGEPGLLTTNLEFGDYHLRVDYRADVGTNSGVFLHTNDKPGREDITTRCYEINIAPDDNPFPTGSIVGRVKTEKSFKEGVWHSMEAKVQNGHITVFVDGQLTADYTDPRPLRRGKIGLQFNKGAIEFRDVKLRPLGLGSFGEGGGQAGWKLNPQSKSALEVSLDGDFRLRGGKGYLESEKQFKDFVLQVEARTNRENQNSGIFFRTIPGSEMNGYECQINNAEKNGVPLDYGTGGIFKQCEARMMPAPEGKWFALTIVCQGDWMGCWVNGTQVSEFHDDRPDDPNPRKGRRLDAGTIQLQGHDHQTDTSFRLFRIAETPARVEPPAQQ